MKREQRKNDAGFMVWYLKDDAPRLPVTTLHNHEGQHEILVFFRGNCEFRAEGTTYYIKPNDILIAQSSEMHRMIHLQPYAPYERLVINISNSFFTINDCEEFKKLFTDRPLGVNNLITAEVAEEQGITDIILRMTDYYSKYDDVPQTVKTSIMIEFLFHLNRVRKKSSGKNFVNENVKDILAYINENITQKLSLDEIAERFFISKSYLCHMFKKKIGLTVNQYVNHKRLLLVKELCSQGLTLTEASTMAGFSSYSNFYKLYLSETGKPPSSDLRQHKTFL